MPSLANQIVDAIETALRAALEPATEVRRSPVDGTRKAPSVALHRLAENFETLATRKPGGEERATLALVVRCFAEGDPWDAAADAASAAAHAALMGSSAVQNLCASRRLVSIDASGEGMADTHGELAMRYEFVYVVRGDALDAKPVQRI